METMSPLDASFLHIEDDVTHMHIGSVGIFEGPAPDRGGVAEAIAAKPAARAALPAARPVRAAGARPPGLGRRPALPPRLPRAPHRAADARAATTSCASSSAG